MYLKSVEIHGFKSFAAKTLFTFLPPHAGRHSVTAIVGPNGSGKSNVADAIRWVMGEQSLKLLRGKKSEDVIFGGSETKGKLGLASVSLTIDNTDHRLDIPHEELVLTRRLYRSGESEYLVNGHVVRLLDVQLLLAKAQFGQGSYGIVGQGMIDRMLTQSSADRKEFFDEASGIKELQIKYHHARLKLARTLEHLGQARALQDEVTPRLKSLSRQVKKREERQAVEQELRERQESYFATLYDRYHREQILLMSGLREVTAVAETLETALRRVQEELGTIARGSSQEERFRELTHEYQRLVEKKNIALRDRAVLQGKLQAEYSQAGKRNVSWLEQKIGDLRTEHDRLTETVSDLAHKRATLAETERQHRATLEGLRVERINLTEQARQLEQVSVERRHEQQVFQAIGLRAVTAILEAREDFGTVFGVVAELGRVQSSFELALNVAAGSHLSSIVVADDTVAERCIRYLRQQELGVATFLPQNRIRPRVVRRLPGAEHSGVHGLAIDLITFDEQFRNIFSFVFGSTLVVEDLATARAVGIGQARMVTRAGDIIEEHGSMKGGYRRVRQHGLSFGHGPVTTRTHSADADTAEIERVQRSLATIDRRYAETDTLLQTATTDRRVMETTHQVAGEQQQALAREIATLEQELTLETMSPETYTNALKMLSTERDTVETVVATIEREIVTAEKQLHTFHEAEEIKKQRIFQLQDLMQEKQAALNTVREQKQEQEIALAKVETKLEDIATEAMTELHVSLELLVRRGIPPVEAEFMETIQTQIQKLKYRLSLIGGIDDAVVAEYAETQARHESLSTQLDDLTKAMSDLERLTGELDDMMRRKRARAFQQIRKEFSRYFHLLFDGGKADLVEIFGEEADEDESSSLPEVVADPAPQKKSTVLVGIDVVASPPGKKITHIQALSGGERTLTAIALICAVLHTNPSPFVLLDEVEAALDEANTGRFVRILEELATQSQFILITHNRATMHAADALYGVTMGGDGMSHVVSVKLGS